MKFLNCFLVLILCSGCVALSPKYSPDLQQGNVVDLSICKPNSIYVTFQEELNDEFGLSQFQVDNPFEVRSDIPHESSAIFNRLKSGPFIIVASKEGNPKYYIHFTTRKNLYNGNLERTWLWASTLTFLILPSWTSGSLIISAEIKDSNGKVIEKISSSSANFSWAAGWVFAPWNFDHFSLIDVTMKYAPILTDEIIIQMAQKKLICYKQ